MKRSILLLMVLVASRLFAQEIHIPNPPGIIYKVDTIRYSCIYYKVAKGSKVSQLLKKMEGFDLNVDETTITHQGILVKKVRINGKDYPGLDIKKSLQQISADIVENIEIIDDYGEEALRTGKKDGDPTQVLNINFKKDKTGELAHLLTAQASLVKANPTLEALLHKMEGIEVDSAGNVLHQGKPVTRVIMHDGGQDTVKTSTPASFVCDIITPDTVAKDPKITKIRLDGGNYDLDYLTQINRVSETNILDRMNEKDAYGDQIPHFIIKPPLAEMRWYTPISQ